jgi:hypothetical protein
MAVSRLCTPSVVKSHPRVRTRFYLKPRSVPSSSCNRDIDNRRARKDWPVSFDLPRIGTADDAKVASAAHGRLQDEIYPKRQLTGFFANTGTGGALLIICRA